MNLYDRPKADNSPIEVGAKAILAYYPRAGPKISIPCTVVKARHPQYRVDTEFQKGVLVNRKDLEV